MQGGWLSKLKAPAPAPRTPAPRESAKGELILEESNNEPRPSSPSGKSRLLEPGILVIELRTMLPMGH
ncbi:hypothetical protein M0802_004395 [Mischocyttarus mexicanus]|nr:hypothetical protein M0802_004395 [Mischocyttarus mexicanus]